MTYTLQEQYTSKNFTAAANVSATFGVPRTVESITIHHWGNKGQQFDTVRDFLCANNTPTSAHYVVQDGLVACIVSPDDAAWHSGNPIGNATSIGIECRPEATDGDYATVAELIATLRGLYGDIPLHPHSYWFNTACPGDYDLARLDSLARGTASIAPQGTVTPQEELVPNATDKVFTDVDGKPCSLQDYLLSLDLQIKAANKAVAGIWSTQATDPTDPGKTYRAIDYVVSSATRGKTNAAAIAGLHSQPAPAGVDVAALAAQLAPLLNVATVDALVAGIKAQWNK